MQAAKIPEILKNFSEYEKLKFKSYQEAAEKEIETELCNLFRATWFIFLLKRLAAAKGFRFAGTVEVSIRLLSGGTINVQSPKFVKTKDRKRKRPGRVKKRNSEATRHFGLELLGIRKKCSPNLEFLVAQCAVISPSFGIAARLLGSFGIECSPDFVRKTTYRLSDILMAERTTVSLDGSEKQPGLKLLICIDGGRLRIRENKKGRIPEGKKRHGYHTDWREPHLFTVTAYNKDGELEQKTLPLYDASMKNLDGAFELLFQHLTQFNLDQAEEITFCADNGNGIWPRITRLAERLKLKKWNEVLDYTHAKQNFQEVLDLLWQSRGISYDGYTKAVDELKQMLWQGNISSIREKITSMLKGAREKKKALAKIDNYFADVHRFQYRRFDKMGIPIGSGAVESAIRRIINLRIKGAGIFWKIMNPEKMMFMRSGFLSGRWNTIQNNYLKNIRNELNLSELDMGEAA
jgi:hypothetical protein